MSERPRSQTAAGARRRTTLAAVLLAMLVLAGGGCGRDDDCICCGPDLRAPAAPQGLASITGDDQVTLLWYPNTEPDLAGYAIYWSDDYDGTYHLITTLPPCRDCEVVEFVDGEAHNGDVYFYAVAAYDDAGNESELSSAYVWDAPRPAGNAAIGNANLPGGAASAGFDLSGRRVVAVDDTRADFHYRHDAATGGWLIAGSEAYGAGETTQLQDMGYTADFDEIDMAPVDIGWSPTGTAEPIDGHTYVLLTRDGHYAKIRITDVSPEQLSFSWGFQTVPGEIQLDAGPQD